jgi:hypothetical protein
MLLQTRAMTISIAESLLAEIINCQGNEGAWSAPPALTAQNSRSYNNCQ